MTAAERVVSLLAHVRPVAEGRWVARCPAHQDRVPSLSVRAGDDRVLLHCHAGCTPEEIVAALGITLSDLFDDHGRGFRFDPVAQRERQAWRALEGWRQTELTSVCGLLRGLDELASHITRFLESRGADLNELGDLSPEDHEYYVSALAVCYHESGGLEERFELLHSTDPADHLTAYRNAGRPHVAA